MGHPEHCPWGAVRQSIVALRTQWRRDTSFSIPQINGGGGACRGTQNDQKGTPTSWEQVVGAGVQIGMKYKNTENCPAWPSMPSLSPILCFLSSQEDLSCKTAFGLRAPPPSPCLHPLHQLPLIQQSLFALPGTLAFKGNRAFSGLSYSLLLCVAARTRP